MGLGTGFLRRMTSAGLCYLLVQAATLACGLAVLIVCAFCLVLQTVGLIGQSLGHLGIGHWFLGKVSSRSRTISLLLSC